jgi:alkylation response protein AidB-like acyl-CoA dehydrogenase
MHIGDSEAETVFRAEAHAWLSEHATPRDPATRNTHADLGEHVEACRRWQAVLAADGWAGITWPKEFGGRGGSAIQSAIFGEEQAKFDVATGSFAVAIGMAGPTLMAHGSTEQQERFLGPMLRGEHVWCQLFSEPDAGSDLAALGTRAELDGDTWVVSGQKVWTSLGQYADFAILLARTDPDVPKHQGITYFVLDMTTPGIEVRPLRQITGVAHFNEVFLSDVRIPAANVVGEVGGGWNVARTTLNSERAFIGGGNNSWSVEELVEMATQRGLADDPVVRQDLMRAHARASALKFLGYRLRTAMSQGRMPGREALIMKLAYARHWAATSDVAMAVLGADATASDVTAPDTSANVDWQHTFLSQYAIRLGGGTDEVQQNIIGELGLGLPREPSVDRNLAWKDLARS